MLQGWRSERSWAAAAPLITAVLLFGQFNFLRSRALFVLASGYLFTAFIAFAHALTSPGVFSPTGWLGAVSWDESGYGGKLDRRQRQSG